MATGQQDRKTCRVALVEGILMILCCLGETGRQGESPNLFFNKIRKVTILNGAEGIRRIDGI